MPNSCRKPQQFKEPVLFSNNPGKKKRAIAQANYWMIQKAETE